MRQTAAAMLLAAALAGAAAAQTPPLMAPLGAPQRSPAAPPGALMAPLPATPAPAPAPGMLMAPLAPARPQPQPAAPAAAPSRPATFATRELPDGALLVAPMWLSAEFGRDGPAALRRYAGKVLQFEATLLRRSHAEDSHPALHLRTEIQGTGYTTVDCRLQNDFLARLLAEAARLDRPATVIGIFRTANLVLGSANALALDDCIPVDGHPDPALLRAALVEEAAIRWERDENARRRQ